MRVHIACRDCPPVGRYRLATLAEEFGAVARLVDVLEAIAAACRKKGKAMGAALRSVSAGPRRPSAAGYAHRGSLTNPVPPGKGDVPPVTPRLGTRSGIARRGAELVHMAGALLSL